MNLLLFEEAFEQTCIDSTDTRAAHLREVLKVELGSLVFVGFVRGRRARAKVTELPDDGSVHLEVLATEAAPPPLPVALLMGLPRPHTTKRLLFETASMGISRIDFFEAEKGEPSYARSSLWQDEAWRERLRLGAEQSFGTHIPEVAMYPDLQTALSAQNPQAARLALDNYESGASLGEQIPAEAKEVVLALGPERGWSSNERDTLQRNGWLLAHLGPYVLRSETAAVAAVSVAASRIQAWKVPTGTQL
ncbi:MAG: RsmE family RNA methyltransferase [Opitutales bacterium]